MKESNSISSCKISLPSEADLVNKFKESRAKRLEENSRVLSLNSNQSFANTEKITVSRFFRNLYKCCCRIKSSVKVLPVDTTYDNQ